MHCFLNKFNRERHSRTKVVRTVVVRRIPCSGMALSECIKGIWEILAW